MHSPMARMRSPGIFRATDPRIGQLYGSGPGPKSQPREVAVLSLTPQGQPGSGWPRHRPGSGVRDFVFSSLNSWLGTVGLGVGDDSEGVGDFLEEIRSSYGAALNTAKGLF